MASRQTDIDKHNLKTSRTVSSFTASPPPNALEDMIKLQEQVAKLTNQVEDLHAKVSDVGELREQVKGLQINTQAAASSSQDTQHVNGMEDIMQLQEQVAKLTNKVLDLQAEVIEIAELREKIKILQGQKTEDIAQIMETLQPMQEQLAFLSSYHWKQQNQQWHEASDWSQR